MYMYVSLYRYRIDIVINMKRVKKGVSITNFSVKVSSKSIPP